MAYLPDASSGEHVGCRASRAIPTQLLYGEKILSIEVDDVYLR